MILDIPPEPNIPEGFRFFFQLVEQGQVRSFRDLCGRTITITVNDVEEQVRAEEILMSLAQRYPDFYEAENIIERVAYDNLEPGLYLLALKAALLEIWPPKAPDVVNQLRQGIGQKRVGVPETNTWSDYQLALNLFSEEVQMAVNSLHPDDIGKIQGAFNTITIDLNEELLNNKQINQAIGKCKGPFNKALGEAWPGRTQPKKKVLSKERTDQATELMEEHFVYRAVCDLIDGNFINLDPVIGDESCESRPSVLIDIWEAIFAAYQNDLVHIISLKFGYCLRHCMDSEPTQLKEVSQIQQESRWSEEFINWCNSVLNNIGDWAVNYLKYCKANTLTSTMACDEWGIASYDRNKGVYTIEGKAQRRGELSFLSIDRIRNLAIYLQENTTENGQKFWAQIVSVLQGVNAFKIDNNNQIHALPIYETMRTVLAYELIKNRPIILSIYRIQYDEESGIYTLGGIQTIVYQNLDGRFRVVDPDTIDIRRPCMSILAYQLVNSNDPINVTDGCNFFSNSGDEYYQGFLGCDIALQAMIYSAVHPPLPHGSTLNDNIVGNDSGREPLQIIQNNNKLETWGNTIEFARNGQITLLDPECDLSMEYQKLYDLGMLCGLNNKQYMSRLGTSVICVRTIKSCAFTIHHINIQSLAQIQGRNNRALGSGVLQRYHNCDKGESFLSEDKAKE